MLVLAFLALVQDPSTTAITGRVVDEQHHPVQGVWLVCSSTIAGSDGGDITDRDGRFEIPARLTGPHVIEVDARGLEERDMPRVEAGTRDLEIVLPPRAFQTFRVLDDATGKAIESLELSTDAPAAIEWGPILEEPAREYRDAPLGVLRARVNRGPRSHYTAFAPGYAPRSGEVRQDLASGVAQEIRMRAGARLRLCVKGTREPLPAAGVRLELCRGAAAVIPGEFRPGEPEVHIRRTDDHGQVEIGELYGGEYLLRIEAQGLPRYERHFLELAPGEARDLGTIEIVPGASLTGRVIVPAGEDPSTVRATCVLAGSRVPVGIARDGGFRLCGLEAGRFALDLPAGQACALALWHFEWELSPNESRWVDLDLAAHWPRPLRVTVLDAGRPAAGVRVLSRGHEVRLSREIATTGADGTVSGRIEPGRGARIVLANAQGIELEDRALDPELAPGAAVEQRFELATGTAGLEVPADFSVAPHPRERLELQFQRMDHPAAPPFSVDVSTDGRSPGVRIDAGRIDLGPVSQGEYEVSLCRIARGGDFVPGTRGLRCSARLRVKAGEATVARLESEP